MGQTCSAVLEQIEKQVLPFETLLFLKNNTKKSNLITINIIKKNHNPKRITEKTEACIKN